MNTSKVADIAEIVSSIAILITLIFLVIQMQQNTAAIQGNTRTATFTADFENLHKSVDHPEIILNYTKPELTD